MEKDDFLLIMDLLRRQYERDLASADTADEELWTATFKFLTLILGTEKSLVVQRWLLDSECGRYPTRDFPFVNDSQVWEYLKTL